MSSADTASAAGVATSQSSRQSEAQALLAKYFPSTGARRSTPNAVKKPPTDPVKLAQYRKIEAMKMRHKAQPVDPRDTNAPLSERLHVYARASEQTDTKIFWVRKTMGTGRALDCFASQLQPTAVPQQLVLDGDVSTVLRNDVPIGSQVEDASTLFISPRP
ncbi:hypothetical protein BD626DRAFT_575483 [Schizophyllum amplum]|uniref:Uncharacterized protein n=1 Tax=Schizophyllum amplum TaxID=97359 RepID=A0A550BVN4_9AGAR|nr:hypothetical protein BD626DRAFT_575483 [Auriculariopsis ampla]